MKTISYVRNATATIMASSRISNPFFDMLDSHFTTKEEAISKFIDKHIANPDADSAFYVFESDFLGDCSSFEKVGFEKWEMNFSMKATISLSDEAYADFLEEIGADSFYDFRMHDHCYNGVLDRVIELDDFLYELDEDYTETIEDINGNLVEELGKLYDEYIAMIEEE